MKKSIWILLVLTASLALVPSRTLAQDAPPDSTTEPAEAPSEEGATSVDADSSDEATDDATSESATSESEATTAESELASPTAQADLEAEAAAAEEETAEEATEEAPAAAPGVPLFRGSMFSWTQGVSAATMNPNLSLTYNPWYYWSFFFQPRLNFDAQNFLVLSVGMSIEWTNSDSTVHEREPVLSDTTIEYRHLERWEGFIFLPSVRLTAPTSLASISAERILSLGAGLTVVRVFPELANLTIAATGRYSHWFGLSNVQTTINDQPRYIPYPGAAGNDQVGGPTLTEDSLLGALTLTVMPYAGLTITTQYAFAWLHRYDATYTPEVGEDLSQDWRNAQYFTLAVAYDVQPWLNVSLGYQTAPGFASVMDQTGGAFNERVNPFWDWQNSELYLSVTVPLDALYEAIAPSDTEEVLTPEQLQRRRQGLARSSGPQLAF